MVKFNRYEEFNDGKIRFSVDCFDDEKKEFQSDEISLELIITAKQALDLKGMTKAYDVLLQSMKVSYPNMKTEIIENFVTRHADDMLEKFLLWSGMSQEKLDDFKKLQETLIKDYIDASPEDKLKFLESRKNDAES